MPYSRLFGLGCRIEPVRIDILRAAISLGRPPSISMKKRRIADPKRKGMSTFMMSYLTMKFLPTIAAIPSTRPILAMFDPKTFPTTISEEPSVTARGEAELPPHRVRHLKRIPYSVVFRLERRGQDL